MTADTTAEQLAGIIELLKSAFDEWDEYGAYHGYSAADDTFWLEGYSFADLSRILAGWVTAREAAAWREGMDHGGGEQ